MSASLSSPPRVRKRDRFFSSFSSKHKAAPVPSNSQLPHQAQPSKARTTVAPRPQKPIQHAYPAISPPYTQHASPATNSQPPPSSRLTSTSTSISTSSRRPITSPAKKSNPAFEQAVQKHLEKLSRAEKDAFSRASADIDHANLFSKVQAIDKDHENTSSVRSRAGSLNNTLGLLSRLFSGAANLAQLNTYASLVVGGVKLILDVALSYIRYFDRLAEMLGQLSSYLGAFETYAENCDTSVFLSALSDAYSDMLDFCQAARRVFLDDNGTTRRHTSITLFLHSQWAPFEVVFGGISSSLEHHRDVLLHVAQGRQLSILNDRERREKGEFMFLAISTILTNSMTVQEQRNFMRWLSEKTHSFHEKHQDILEKRHHGTGDWLLLTPEFLQWSNSTSSKLLWCHGKPGAGKSVLAASVIEHLLQRYALRKDVGVCYAYYSFDNPSFQGRQTLFATLLQQLCVRMDFFPDELLDMRNLSLIGQAQLYKVFGSYKEVFVVVDGLDECPSGGKEKVLESLKQAARYDGSTIKTLVSSRREDDIVRCFESPYNIILPVGPQQTRRDIEKYVREETMRLRRSQEGLHLAIRSDALFEEVVKILIQKSGGMFLWVNIQLRTLCEESEAGDSKVKKALSRLPEGLTNTYARILDAICHKSPTKREIAFNCFRWVLYAQRPITWSELTFALPLADSDPPNDLPELERQAKEYRFAMIVEACGNLLINGDWDEFVTPIHFTVLQFFRSTLAQIKFQATPWIALTDQKAMHCKIAQECLQFLRFSIERCPLGRAITSQRATQLGYNTFTRYAINFFDHHALESSSGTTGLDPVLLSRINKVLTQNEEYLAKFLEIRLTLKPDPNEWEEEPKMCHPVSASSIVRATQLYNIPAVTCKWNKSTKRGNSDYVLHYASKSGVFKAVEDLVAESCDVDEMDAEGKTPLYYACENGHESVVELLLRKHASQRVGNHIPLWIAVREGHLAVVKRLLQHGAEVNTLGRHAEAGKKIDVSALHTALRFGHHSIVEQLVRNGARLNTSDGLGFNALHVAAAWAAPETVKLVLGAGATVNAVDPATGKTALHLAVVDRIDESLRKSSFDICRILCGKDLANLRVLDKYGSTAIHYAAQYANSDLVAYLVSRGSDVSLRDGAGRSLVDIAACNALDPQVLNHVLKHVLLSKPPRYGFSSLHWSCKSDCPENTQLLLDHGFKVSIFNTTLPCKRWTPFDLAVHYANTQVFSAYFDIPLELLGQGMLPDPAWKDRNATWRKFVCDTCHLTTPRGPYFECKDCKELKHKICLMCANNPGSMHQGHKLRIMYALPDGKLSEAAVESEKMFEEDSAEWRNWATEKRKEKMKEEKERERQERIREEREMKERKRRKKREPAADPGAEEWDSDMWYSDWVSD